MEIHNKSFKYYCQLWEASVYLYIGDWDSFTEFMWKKFHLNKNKLNYNVNSAALSLRITTTSGGRSGYAMWMPNFGFLIKEYAILAHETLHIAADILDDRNVYYMDESKESLAYTFDDIYEAMLKKLHKFYNVLELEVVNNKKD